MNIRASFDKSTIDFNNEKNLLAMSRDSYELLETEGIDYSGWVSYPKVVTEGLIDEIEDAARGINKQCSLLVVVGIGGSYLGAKAVIDALGGPADGCADVIFAGYSMSAGYLSKIAERMEKEETCLCVISKSGRTVEPMLVYHILEDVLVKRYGAEEASRRIYVVTDKTEGSLRKEAQDMGCKAFEVPEGIGGRYSVLTPVGLLPIAAAGYDIKRLVAGAAEISDDLSFKDGVINYAVCRNSLQAAGKDVEIFEYFEANLKYFGEWLKQLFAESEGKDGKGAYPTSLCFSKDLHSMGQFLQQGKQVFYETMIRVKTPNYDFIIPDDAGELFAGKSLEQINACSEAGVIRAHFKAGIPIIVIDIPRLDEYSMGELIYFFEMACAVSALNNGLNPFDQPGVEAYKEEMIGLVRGLEQQVLF